MVGITKRDRGKMLAYLPALMSALMLYGSSQSQPRGTGVSLECSIFVVIFPEFCLKLGNTLPRKTRGFHLRRPLGTLFI